MRQGVQLSTSLFRAAPSGGARRPLSTRIASSARLKIGPGARASQSERVLCVRRRNPDKMSNLVMRHVRRSGCRWRPPHGARLGLGTVDDFFSLLASACRGSLWDRVLVWCVLLACLRYCKQAVVGVVRRLLIRGIQRRAFRKANRAAPPIRHLAARRTGTPGWTPQPKNTQGATTDSNRRTLSNKLLLLLVNSERNKANLAHALLTLCSTSASVLRACAVPAAKA